MGSAHGLIRAIATNVIASCICKWIDGPRDGNHSETPESCTSPGFFFCVKPIGSALSTWVRLNYTIAAFGYAREKFISSRGC